MVDAPPAKITGQALYDVAEKSYGRDACALRETSLFRTDKGLAKLVAGIKSAEETLISAHFKDDPSQQSLAARKDPHCVDGVCNVASGGAYLCMPVMDYQMKIVENMDGGIACMVGAGSSKPESHMLAASPRVTVVTFDLFDDEYKEKIVQLVSETYGDRWRPVRGRFEITSKSFGDIVMGGTDRKCDFISFDTNNLGEAMNNRHWHMVNTFLQKPGTVMMVQSGSYAGYASYCAKDKAKCTFNTSGEVPANVVGNKKCCTDPGIVPSNMHPAVLGAIGSDSWGEGYLLGMW